MLLDALHELKGCHKKTNKKEPQPTNQNLKTNTQRNQSHTVFSPCGPVAWGNVPQLHLELILLLACSDLILWVLGFLIVFSLVGWLVWFIFILVIGGCPPYVFVPFHISVCF